MNDNDITLAAYEAKADEYVAKSPADISPQVKTWIDTLLHDVPLDAPLIEFGSGPGRDARYIASRGYTLTCTDATESFLEILRAAGFAARKLNLLTDDIEGSYDRAFANAVLLHFSPDELAGILKKVRSALTEDGQFGFTLKAGEGSAWSEGKLDMPRYFQYWNVERITQAVKDAGFSAAEVTAGPSPKGDEWLLVIASR